MWWDIIETIGLSGIGIAAIAWLIQKIVIHWLDKDVEKFRNKLQCSHDVEIEKFRNDLNIRSIEHEIRFRSIHEKQAEILAETYSHLHEVHSAVTSYVKELELGSEPSKDEKAKVVYEAYEKFRAYFYPRKIYFPRQTGDRVQELGNKLVKTANTFAWGQWRERQGRPLSPEKENHWDTTAKMMEEEIPPLLEQLVNDFQNLLGVK